MSKVGKVSFCRLLLLRELVNGKIRVSLLEVNNVPISFVLERNKIFKPQPQGGARASGASPSGPFRLRLESRHRSEVSAAYPALLKLMRTVWAEAALASIRARARPVSVAAWTRPASVYRALLEARANRLERMGFAPGDILTNY